MIELSLGISRRSDLLITLYSHIGHTPSIRQKEFGEEAAGHLEFASVVNTETLCESLLKKK